MLHLEDFGLPGNYWKWRGYVFLFFIFNNVHEVCSSLVLELQNMKMSWKGRAKYIKKWPIPTSKPPKLWGPLHTTYKMKMVGLVGLLSLDKKKKTWTLNGWADFSLCPFWQPMCSTLEPINQVGHIWFRNISYSLQRDLIAPIYVLFWFDRGVLEEKELLKVHNQFIRGPTWQMDPLDPSSPVWIE